MKLLDVAREVRRHLEENGRVSVRLLRRDYELDDEALDELIEELVEVQQIARREGNVLVWVAPATPTLPQRGGRTEQAETRKTISILFADLMGSTALQERLDPESVNRVMDAYYQAVRGPVEAAGGSVVQLLGDGVLCAFGIPTIAEDDALRAVRAAIGVQRAFHEFLGTQQWLSVAIGLRVAVNTGEVVVSDEHPAGIGDPLNVAARLQQEARDGEVLIGAATRRLVADAVTLESAGVFALKGRAETVAAYRVVSLERPKGVATAAFVGRDDEMARIIAVYEAALVTPAARLAALVGSPGLGKSRLIEEVARRLGDDATVVTAQCDAAGGATFAPVAEALRQWLGANPTSPTGPTSPTSPTDSLEVSLPADFPDRARIIAGITALLAGSPASPEETFFVIRRLLTALAHSRPVVLVIDDLHWAEPLLLDLIEHLIQWGSGVPLFVLIGARPELRNLRSSLVTRSGLVSEVVTLAGLDAGAAMRLAANVIGASDLPTAVAAKVLATSEGNPLFVGELVRMLVDEGAIERQGERWVVGANLAALEMPPTIHALLAARIERLRPDDRTVLERAAVVGRHFSRGAVAALLGRNGNSLRAEAFGEGSELDARLEALRRTELIESDSGWFLGEPVLRFHHVLIRDAAYRRLLKGTRAELHERLADWIEAQVGDLAEHDETIGWHLEQAHQHLREIGPLDAKGRGLGERAADRLAAAGRRALGRDDLPVAADLLGRAVDRLDAEDSKRADLALDWCEALLSAGDVGPAVSAIAELGRFANPSHRLRAWHTCFSAQLTVLTAPQGLQAAADSVAGAAQQLAALGDAAGEAKAHSVHATALARLGRVGACEAALDQALAAARRAGDRRRANAVLAGAPLAALWGPSPVTRASGRCLDVVRVLRITQGAPAVESVALSCQGVLEALRGRTEAAQRMLASARKMVEELGIAHRLFEADAFAGRIAAMEGDTAAAEKLLRGAYQGLRDLGLGIDAARAGALLARALLAQDRIAEAEALSHESEALAGDDLQAAIAWRGVRAEALAKRGEHAAAVDLAKAAVAIASATDALLDHADARRALAAALRAAGRNQEADAEDRRATELWETKGATLLAERVRRDHAHGEAVAPKAEQPEELVRIDETAAGAEPRPLVRRPLLPNVATAVQDRYDVALAARDFDALAAVFDASHQEIDHPTGSTYGRDACIASIRRLFRSRQPYYQVERLATLGELLLLVRRRSGASGAASGHYDVGAYENEAIQLLEADQGGRCCRTEVFAADRLANAIARLYERHAELLPDGPEHELAAATARSMAVQLEAPNDGARAAAVIAPDFESVDHRHLSTWSMRGGSAYLDHLRALTAVATDIVIGVDDVLALAPDALLVRRMHSGTERLGGGAYERPFLVLFATDAAGQLARAEWFDAEGDARALACFAEIAAGEAEMRPEPFANAASRTDSKLFRCFNGRDWEGVLACVAPVMVFDERRRLVRNTCGRDVWLEQFRFLFDVPQSRFASQLRATRGERLALNFHRFEGEVAEGGGPLALDDHLALHEVDADGRIVGIVLFDLEDEVAAHAELDARFAELAGPPAAVGRFENAASRAWREVNAVWRRRDVECFAALHPPALRYRDHRRLVQLDLDREGFLAFTRPLLEMRSNSAALDLLATRGERLALMRSTLEMADDTVGPSAIDSLVLIETDERGAITAYDRYEIDDQDTARAEIQARWEAGEGAIHPHAAAWDTGFDAAVDRRDWDAAATFYAPAFVGQDHRLVGWGTLHGPGGPILTVQTLVELAPDVRTRTQHLRASNRGLLQDRAWSGTRDGGAFENPFLDVIELDGSGRAIRMDLYDSHHLERALARFAEIGAGEARDPSSAGLRRTSLPAALAQSNLATVFTERAWAAFDLVDMDDAQQALDAARAHFSPDFVWEDRRPIVGLSGGLDLMLASARERLASGARHQRRTIVGTAGDRVAVGRILWAGGPPDGRFEVEFLALHEVNEAGLCTALIFFDPDDERAAQREAWARWAAIDPVAAPWVELLTEIIDAWNSQDRPRLRARLDDDVVIEDHRHAGLGRIEGANAYVDSNVALWDLAPDQRVEFGWSWPAIDRHGLVVTGRRAGTLADGGAFESEYVWLFLARSGRITRVELFEIDALDRALARFEELRPPSPRTAAS